MTQTFQLNIPFTFDFLRDWKLLGMLRNWKQRLSGTDGLACRSSTLTVNSKQWNTICRCVCVCGSENVACCKSSFGFAVELNTVSIWLKRRCPIQLVSASSNVCHVLWDLLSQQLPRPPLFWDALFFSKHGKEWRGTMKTKVCVYTICLHTPHECKKVYTIDLM